MRWLRRRAGAGSERGSVTVEAALELGAVAVVLVLCLAGLAAVSMQTRCIDAAREAARLAARGDSELAVQTARAIAPAGSVVQLRRDGQFLVATVSVRPALLPGLGISADAVAAAEPGTQ